MPDIFNQEQAESLTVQISSTRHAWLQEQAAQGNIDVSTVLFWVLHHATREKHQPWPAGVGGWRPWSNEEK